MAIREENKKVQDNIDYKSDKDKMQKEMLMAKLTNTQKAALKKKLNIANLTGEPIKAEDLVKDKAFIAGGDKKEPATVEEINNYLKEIKEGK
jgi:Cdc6-like AAA superfamily ATPase